MGSSTVWASGIWREKVPGWEAYRKSGQSVGREGEDPLSCQIDRTRENLAPNARHQKMGKKTTARGTSQLYHGRRWDHATVRKDCPWIKSGEKKNFGKRLKGNLAQSADGKGMV